MILHSFKKLSATAFLLCMLFTTDTFSQIQQLVLQPDAAAGKDAGIFVKDLNDNYGGSNSGIDTMFRAERWTSGDWYKGRGLIQFDLSSIPANAVVISASLYLYGLDHQSATQSNACTLKRITSSWTEGNGTLGSGVSWNTQPTIAASGISLPQSTSATQNYTVVVTNDVQDMVTNASGNYGWTMMLALDGEATQARAKLRFASSDNLNPAKRPKLIVNYYVPLAVSGRSYNYICPDGSVNITSTVTGGPTGNYTYSWTPATGLSCTNCANPTASPLVTTNYTLTATDGSNVSSAVYTVPVHPAISVNVGGNQTICSGSSTTALGSAATGGTAPFVYAWSPATGLSNTNTYGPTASPAGSTTYTLTVTDDNACTKQGSVLVQVNPQPSNATVGSTQNICGTVSNALGGNTPSVGTGAWSKVSGPGTITFSSPYSGSSTATAGSTGTYVLQWTISNPPCAAKTASVTVNYYTTPTITGTTPASRCGTGTVVLGATASAGTINWYTVATGGSSIGTGTSYTTTSLSATTTYYVDATSNGCTTAGRTAVVATVNTIPSITGTTPGSRCGTGTVVLGATASAGTINWYAASTGGSSLGTGTSFTTPSISSTTTYYVDATSNGCTTASRTAVVATVATTLTPAVSIAITSGSNPSCTGNSITFTATPTNGGTTPAYQWKVNGSNVGTNSTAFSSSTLVSTNTVTCVMTSNASCANPTTATSNAVMMTVNPFPTPTVTASPSFTICAGKSATLTASGGSSYNWNTGATTAAVTVAPTANTGYSVTVTSAGCSVVATRTVTVNASPAVSIATSPSSTICSGASVTLTASGGTTYTWNTGATTAAVTVTPASTTGYTATVTNANGCSAVATKTITVNASPSINVSSSSSGGGGALATGGTITTSGAYTIHTFTTGGTFTPSSNLNVEYLVAAGGGGGGKPGYGGDAGGGGGGAGGLRTGTLSVTATSYAITVGAGGAGGAGTPGIKGTNGGNSIFSTITAAGGGGGGAAWTGANAGGSGGGASYDGSSGGAASPAGQGNAGGNGLSGNFAGAGGGGAGAAGNNPGGSGTSGTGGNGGTGSASSITGTSVTYAAGGGGGTYLTSTPGSGGSSIGGNGGSNGANGANGVANTGSGGGGGGANASPSASGNGGSGASGIVIIRYLTPVSSCGGTTTLTASGASTYAWSPSTGLNSTTGAVVVATLAATTVYTVTGTNANGCTALATKTVTVGAPTVTVTPASAAICNGSSITLTAGGASTYVWSPSTGLSAATGSSVIASPTATITYSVTGTDAGGCTATAVKTVTVNASPSINVSSSSSGGGALATGGTITTSGAYTIHTFTTGGTFTPSSNLNVEYLVIAGGGGGGKPDYSGDAGGGGGGAGGLRTGALSVTATSYAITVGAGGAGGTGTPGVTGTNGGNSIFSTITATGGGGGGVAWTNANAGGSGGGGSYGGAGGAASPAGQGNTGGNGLTGNFAGAGGGGAGAAGNNPGGSGTSGTGGSGGTGSASSISGTSLMYAAGGGGGTYLTSTPGSGGSSIGGNGGSNGANGANGVANTGSGGGGGGANASPSASGNGGSGASGIVIIRYLTPASNCGGTTTTLTASGASTYLWSPSAGLNTTTGATVIAAPSATTVYSVTGTNANGCSAIATKTVTINPTPTPTITTWGSSTICSGASAVLTASGGATYLWSTGSTSTSITVAPTSASTYSVTAISIAGCTAANYISLAVNAGCLVNYIPGFSGGGTPPPLNPALEVGTTAGSFAVSQSGNAAYIIPIAVPPGTQGMTPQLSVSYNSNGSDDIMGLGWSLSGLSSISRAGQSVYYNGSIGPVSLTNADNFVMDGNYLIPASGANGANGTVYGTEVESFSRITSVGQTGASPDYFTVETKDGSILEYGRTADSRIEAQGSTIALTWLLNKVTDNRGNYMLFRYYENPTSGEFYPDYIEYTGTGSFAPYNKIKFVYNSKNYNSNFTYVTGHKIFHSGLLSALEIHTLGQKVKEYDFNYSLVLGKSHLSEVIEKDKDGKQFNSTKFVWDENYSITPIANILPDYYIDKPMYVLDVNGDGYSDYVKMNNNSSWTLKVNNFINYGDATFTTPPSYATGTLPSSFLFVGPGKNLPDGGKEAFLNPSDLNGDGYDDLIIFNPSYYNGTSQQSSSFYYWLSNKSGLVPGVEPLIPQGDDDTDPLTTPFTSYTYGDFNGDGATDLFVYYDNFDTWYVYSFKNCTPGGSTFPDLIGSWAGTAWYSTNTNIPSRFHPMDMNGDGKSELAVITATGGFYVYELTSPTNFSLVYLGDQLNDVNDAIYPGDFDGDGKTDILIWKNATQSWKICFSTGVDFPDSGAPGNLPILSRKNIATQLYIGDVNGDGTTDVVEKTSKGNNEGTDIHTMIFHFGKYTEDTKHFTANYGSTTGPSVLSNGDFNGDGHADFMVSEGFPQSNAYFTILPGEELHKVQKIYNGLNALTTINYNSLPLMARLGRYVKSNNALYPLKDFQNNMIVVDNVIEPSAVSGTNNTVNYSYEGAKTHVQGKGFLGFTKVGSIDLARAIKSENTYSLPVSNTFFQRTLTSTQVSQSVTPFTPISLKTVTSYSFTTGAGLPITDNSNPLKRYYYYESNYTVNDQLHGNLTTTYTVTQDKWGNTTSAASSNAAVTSSTSNTFETKGAWIPSCVKSYTTTVTRSGQPAYTRFVNFTNNNFGQPLTRTEDAGAITTYVYDDTSTPLNPTPKNFGNLLKTTVSGITVPRSNENTYDSYGRFAVKQTNALNHSVQMPDRDAFGNIQTEIDANGIPTYHTYDGFGRLKSNVIATSVPKQLSIARVWDSSVPGSIFKVETSMPGTPTSAEYFDNYNRSLRTETTGFNGTLIKTDKTYTALGEIATVSEPFSSGSAASFTTYTYNDVVRRITKVTLPSAAYTDYSYSGNTTTTTSHQGIVNKTQTKILDASGMLVSSADAGGTITYVYHSSGKPKTITPPGGNAINMTYDAYGRQLSLQDPDAGTIRYDYNALGEIVHQQDAKQLAANSTYSYTLSYDALGRLTRKDSPQEGDIIYTYDNKTNGIGMLGTVSGTGTFTTTCNYEYNAQGLLASKTENLGADGTYTHSYEYDEWNRLKKETYPGSSTPNAFATGMEYNSNGYLEKIRDANASIATPPIWQCNEMNERGKITNASSGNGLGINKTYTSLGYPLTADISDGTTDTWIQQYDFDATTGNLTSRTSSVNGAQGQQTQSELFHYDNLDRLTDIYLNGSSSPTHSTSYPGGSIGNIGSKTDASASGAYEYTGAQPHAVSGIALPGSNISTVAQTVAYTPFNRVDNMAEYPYSLQFKYGQDYARIKSVLKNTSSGATLRTVIYSGNYEKITKGSVIYEVYYINSPDGLAAMNIRSGGTDAMKYIYTDHMGSIDLICDQNKNKVFEQSFDAWGRERDPADWAQANPTAAPDWLIRGFTGHEHHKEFGLINMNGRLYDPVVGKMLSPDPFVQASDFTQSYNRYSYAWNNPLKYADPTGMLIAPTLDDEVGGFNLGSLARMFSGTTRGWDKSLHDEVTLSRDPETGQYYVRGAIPVSTSYAMNVANSMARPMTVGDLVDMMNGTDPSQSSNLGPEIASLDGGPETKNGNEIGTKILDGMQTGLDIVGLVPGFGEIADGVNALIYTGRGDYVNAGLSAAAMMPIAGWLATGGKLTNKAIKYGDRVEAATDLYHTFPSSFDNHIIQNGAWSQRIKDGANWYELPGTINGTSGMYQIGINNSNVIFHRNFIPFK